MKFADLKIGESYARGKWGNKVTVEGIHTGGTLPEGYKYYSQYSWRGQDYTAKKLVLVVDEEGRKACVNPQELKAQWDAFEAQKKADRAAREERFKRDHNECEDRKSHWKLLAPVLEKAGIDVWRGVECGTPTIEVTAEQLRDLIKQVQK